MFFDKITAKPCFLTKSQLYDELNHFFLFAFKYRFCMCLVHIQENQLVQELLLKLSDSLHKHIGILGMCMKKCHAKKKKVFG